MLPRWLTNKIAEYDLINEYWVVKTLKDRFDPHNKDANLIEFYAFANTVYVDPESIVVLGGLDDRIANQPNFSNRTLLLVCKPENQYDNHYTLKMMDRMQSKRGCGTAVHHAGYVYVMGGINYTEKVLKRCERLNLEKNVW